MRKVMVATTAADRGGPIPDGREKEKERTSRKAAMVSGQWYTVTEVDGRPPTGLASCVGERVLTLAMNGLSHRMFGTGVEHSARVRFIRKISARTARRPGVDDQRSR